ncbi:hypothetical protein TNCV_4748311 [Trichonephila clavipes]|nr:hypothetical protein TNCV_4748311 [Trichonephila clavipes]
MRMLVSVILTVHYKATRGLLATDLVILNLFEVTRTPELEPSLLATAPTEGRLSLNRFNVHWSLHDGSSVAPGLKRATFRSRVHGLDH